MDWPKPDSDHLIVTSAEMECLEKLLISQGMPVESLMEKVGLGMRNWILKRSDILKNGVVFLVGPGHNGGDGLVLARELFLLGFQVSLWCPFLLKKPLTIKHFEYCKWLGIQILERPPEASCDSLWIEALFGIGQDRSLPDEISTLLKARDESQPGRLISLDVPAGICSDTGKSLAKSAAKASFTLTVGLVKQGLIQDLALPYVGKLVRVDFGIPQIVLDQKHSKNHLRVMSDDLKHISWPHPSKELDKYHRGRVLVLAGSDQYKGAASLALKGALASGVGSTSAFLDNSIANDLWQVLPEVVVSCAFRNLDDCFTNLKKTFASSNLNRFDSVLIGPGFLPAKNSWTEFGQILEDFSGLLVVDADALNGISLSEEGWKWIRRREGPTWITPHPQEFSRLFPDLKNLVPLEAASKAAIRTSAGVLLKGAHSVIASPSGSVWQLGQTSSLVARTGLGDVLAGFLAGIGAVGVALKPKCLNCDLLAAAAFLHAEVASNYTEGSNASSICTSLEKITRRIQERKCIQRYI
ncbi:MULTISPECIES: bifunctional ADP-dependent NAD(P)H-hydrate dehydratase/NAD(P)H-hydrate epimerase [Prochlorococcus]|uniref:bifunctional ADP-dependent NAD(P)H-hydrate dehydratase/NAD(P)H-hydrate epimerase n=1 Tax=Prochlorococcus TaxID=1218 RepID=UPI0005339326|nr:MULTISPECIES: bifunctional ADP-dependent NAD(P)H-hydrate dehydratase/NAD(P)H-hydrate epimerase [Prochlorococcus]KGG11996.1 NAD(P)HX epimerase [Prochlorococcus sp. MIT 0601]